MVDIRLMTLDTTCDLREQWRRIHGGESMAATGEA
jgi:hypothetical protein